MIVYRPHRRTLIEALEEVKEFNNEDEMKEYIVSQWHGWFDVDDIVINEEEHYDDRIEWKNTRHICIKRCANEIYKNLACIGMCATDYDKKFNYKELVSHEIGISII